MKRYLFAALIASGILIPAYAQTISCGSGFSSTGSCSVGSAAANAGQHFPIFGDAGTGAGLSGSAINLQPTGVNHAPDAVIYQTPVSTTAFTTTFQFTANAWNLAFILENATHNGGAGPSPGYTLAQSFASGAGCEGGFYQAFGGYPTNPPPNNIFVLNFDQGNLLINSVSPFYSNVQIYQQVQSPCIPNDASDWYYITNKVSSSPVPMDSPATTYQTSTGDTYSATLFYTGTNLVLNLYDVTASGTCSPVTSGSCFTYTWQNVNIPALVDGTTAYLGFAGSSNANTPNPLDIYSLTYSSLSAASAPTFSPVAGSYGSTQSVTLTSSSSGSIICYNTTGAPSTNGQAGCTNSALYSGAISVSSSETIYAVAGGSGYGDSSVSSSAYVIGSTAAAPTFYPAGGTYQGNQTVTMASAISGSSIYYNTTGSPTCGSTAYSTPITVSANETIYALACKSGLTTSGTSTAAYVINPFAVVDSTTGSYPAASPTFSPLPGSYSGTQSVTLATTTSAAGTYICYTAASSPPTLMVTTDNLGGCVNGTLYTGAISVSSSKSIYAVAGTSTQANLAGSGPPSFAVQGAYTISGATASTPTFSPVAGAYTGTQSVLLSTTSSGAVLCYNTTGSPATNGSTGCASGTLYTGPVTVSSSETLYAVAGGTGYGDSAVGSAAYTITPSSSTVTNLGYANAAVAANGLGFNLTSGSLQEVQLAAAAGATHARVQCGWSGVENQTAPPNNHPGSPQYTLNSNCQTDLTNYKTYGIHPTLLAAFGPPYRQILSVVIPAGASVGANSLTLQFSSGIGGDTVASLKPFFDNILTASNGQISNNNSYPGDLIIGVTPIDSTHATVSLASAVNTALPANTTTAYIINEGLYVPALTSGPTDVSVIAYTNYARFLAGTINAAGLTGEVELWNEPPWAGDPWDNRGDFYDTWPGNQTPGPLGRGYPNPGFAAVLQSSTPYAGVTYNWGGTHKSGFNTLPSLMPSNTGVAEILPPTLVDTEGFHPYGNNPEDNMTSLPCLKTTLNTYPALPNSWLSCNLISTSSSNLGYGVQYSLYENSNVPGYGLAHNVTETGIPNSSSNDPAHQARFIIRQFLELQAAGISPVQFYRLYDNSGQGFGFVNGSYQPYPAYTAIQGLMKDISTIKGAPNGSPALPTVTSYSGTYQLDTAAFVGTQPGTATNGIIYAVWQQSTTTGTWSQLAQPAAVPVTVALPAGTVVLQLVNLDTRASVAFTQSGQNVTFNVSDDPIEVLAGAATVFGAANSTLSNGTVSNGTRR